MRICNFLCSFFYKGCNLYKFNNIILNNEWFVVVVMLTTCQLNQLASWIHLFKHHSMHYKSFFGTFDFILQVLHNVEYIIIFLNDGFVLFWNPSQFLFFPQVQSISWVSWIMLNLYLHNIKLLTHSISHHCQSLHATHSVY